MANTSPTNPSGPTNPNPPRMNPQALIVILQAREANSSIKTHSLPLVLALPCVTTIFVCKGALESDFSRPIHSPLNLGKQSMIGLDPITSALNIAPRPLQLLTPRPRRQGCSRRLESVAKLRRYCKFRTRMTGFVGVGAAFIISWT